MSVSKNRATNLLLSSEQSSLRRFLALYFILVVILLSSLGIFYYQSKEKLMLSNQRRTLSTYAHEQIQKLRELHQDFPKNSTYPRSENFNSAIYDIERSKIFSTLNPNEIIDFDKAFYRKNGIVRFMTYLDDYYLGAKYLFIETDENRDWYFRVIRDIFVMGIIILIIFLIFGVFFVNLFLRPMKNSMILLDNFIKDTTHELNTPISAILANVEMMDLNVMSEKNIKKLLRINIAAKTVSHLYQDLTYLTLDHNRESNDEWVDLKKLIEDRVEYFTILAGSKKVTFNLDLNYSTIFIDCVKIARVIDNLISNAIKYNKRGGEITVILRRDYLEVKDTGIGIESEKVNDIFERYRRFNSSEGGFGIGLNIVKSIIEEYELDISVKSILKEGTTIRVDFLKGVVDEK